MYINKSAVDIFMAFFGTYGSQVKNLFQISIDSNELNQANFNESHHNENTNEDVSGSSSSSSTDENGSNAQPSSNENTQAPYPGILDTELTALTPLEKRIFITLLMILCLLSVFGNTSTLFVNTRRKIRPFFRACLISLAFSDLMNTIFISIAYMSQFTEEYVQIWHLGAVMCGFVPFATTAAILASSMTLVGIAVDRYYAVMKAVIGFWNPSIMSSCLCMFFIWLASLGIASPVFIIYDMIPVYILTEDNTGATLQQKTNRAAATTNAVNMNTTSGLLSSSTMETTLEITVTTSATMKLPWSLSREDDDDADDNLSYILVRQEKLVNMCVSEQKNVSMYYIIVFVIIFIPCIGAFFWFNSIIAKKLWKRRHAGAVTKRKSKKIKNKSNGPATAALPKVTIEMQQGQQQQQIGSQMAQSRILQLQPPMCNCKSGHSSTSTMPSSLEAQLGVTAGMQRSTIATNHNGMQQQQQQAIGSTPAPTTATGINNNSRVARHLRMFTIILLMMAVFVFLRLPSWIFLLMRMYGSYTKPVDWLLYFVFGILSLTSSVLNPLFYTFLTETIEYFLRLKAKCTAVLLCGGCSNCFNCCCRHCKSKRCNSKSAAAAASNEPQLPPSSSSSSIRSSKRIPADDCRMTTNPQEEPKFPLNFCCGCGDTRSLIRATWHCQPSEAAAKENQHQQNHNHCNNDAMHQQCAGLEENQQQQSNVLHSKQDSCVNSEHCICMDNFDEGVDCSDDVDVDDAMNDYYDFDNHIYAIFPISLVSSSMHSH